MHVFFDIPTTDTADRCFFTWAPVKAEIRLLGADTSVSSHSVTLRNDGAADGGRVNFDTKKNDEGLAEITLDLASDGTPSEIWIAGEFGEPSKAYADAAIVALDDAASELGRRDCMVRVRKNATTLSNGERDRFLEAMAQLNDAGAGPFRGFREMHVQASQPEAHGAAAFLPWHRAYILDLERSLQEIDASVAMPYWRFDQSAPTLFEPEFLGMPDPNPANGDEVLFPPGHPLEFWRTDTSDPVERRPRWDINVAPPQQISDQFGSPIDWVISQTDTLALGGVNNRYALFRGMEGAPHGTAHVSFLGPISSVPTAAKDPLFFLLHTNVDRLWAFWQWFHKRTDSSESDAYSLDGSNRFPDNLGHKLDDTMWPWNQISTAPRPTFPPPRPTFPGSPFTNRPSDMPTVREMVDYHGVFEERDLGFSYDDVPFEFEVEEGVV